MITFWNPRVEHPSQDTDPEAQRGHHHKDPCVARLQPHSPPSHPIPSWDLTTLSLRISRLLQYMHYLYIYLLIDTAIQYFMWDSEISYKWLEKEILKIFFY